jgi:peptidylprolyl isomerase
MTKLFIPAVTPFLLYTFLLVTLAQGQATEPLSNAPITETKSGLKYQEIVEGSGPAVAPGKKVTCHYTGKLKDGTVFDSSLKSGRPFVFTHKVTQLIPGWTEGVATMKTGGKRRLFIPSNLGYGSNGAGDVIPPNADLIFDLEVLKVE